MAVLLELLRDQRITDENGNLTPEWQRLFDDLFNAVSDLTDGQRITLPDRGELTIASGVVTVTGSYHTVDTESDAASDDLDTINGFSDGYVLVIQAENDARTVVAKDGTGNLNLAGDFSLDSNQDTLAIMYSDALTAWVELSRSSNA